MSKKFALVAARLNFAREFVRLSFFPAALGFMLAAPLLAADKHALSPPALAEDQSYCLELRAASGDLAYSTTLGREERFTLRHIHSVHKTPVVEQLGLGPNDSIAILEGRYSDFGAGLAARAEKDQELTFEDGHARLQFARRHVPEIELRVGRVAEHTLIVRAGELPLTLWASPGEYLVFKARGGICAQRTP
ncbi:MAG: DUF1850 domain-containing protein [Deltaproteobacteria bacterium]|jgi:hypothetical protein|nr:DUF1850 domain-containing protein [Deltaproteobacteria bacterium]